MAGVCSLWCTSPHSLKAANSTSIINGWETPAQKRKCMSELRENISWGPLHPCTRVSRWTPWVWTWPKSLFKVPNTSLGGSWAGFKLNWFEGKQMAAALCTVGEWVNKGLLGEQESDRQEQKAPGLWEEAAQMVMLQGSVAEMSRAKPGDSWRCGKGSCGIRGLGTYACLLHWL